MYLYLHISGKELQFFTYIFVFVVTVSLVELKISFIECPSVVHSNSDCDDIPIGVHGGLPRG